MPRCKQSTSHEHLLALFTARPDAFWRHDVDVSLEAAAKMARFAHVAGARSTFYIMSVGEFYNPFSPASARAIASIHDHGHRIGLHCDYRPEKPMPTIPYGVEIIEAHDRVWPEVQRQRRLLLNAYPEFVDPRLVSFHIPPPEVLWSHFQEFENAYGPQWLGRYLSDSRGVLGDESGVLEMEGPIQVNLHPEHWFGARRPSPSVPVLSFKENFT